MQLSVNFALKIREASMLKQSAIGLALLLALATSPGAAQQAADVLHSQVVVFTERQVESTGAAGPSPALLTQLTAWLEVNFDLPAANEPPRVERVSAARMAAVRFRGLVSDRQAQVAAEAGRLAPPEFGQEVYAVYDDSKRIVYLHTHWSADSPADVSVLVHELVHHLQNVAGAKFACPQEREKDAYQAQRAWLDQFGRTIEDEFEIDPMTVLVRTNCGF
jgi:hypothetical protein